jgi:hypothetical protein
VSELGVSSTADIASNRAIRSLRDSTNTYSGSQFAKKAASTTKPNAPKSSWFMELLEMTTPYKFECVTVVWQSALAAGLDFNWVLLCSGVKVVETPQLGDFRARLSRRSVHELKDCFRLLNLAAPQRCVVTEPFRCKFSSPSVLCACLAAKITKARAVRSSSRCAEKSSARRERIVQSTRQR